MKSSLYFYEIINSLICFVKTKDRWILKKYLTFKCKIKAKKLILTQGLVYSQIHTGEVSKIQTPIFILKFLC